MRSTLIRIALFAIALETAWSAAGQSGTAPDYAKWFAFPEMQLRTETMSDNSKAVEPNPVVVAAHSGSNKVQLDYYEQQPLKLKLPPQKSADSFVQALESESEPKVYHFGKHATFECSLLTAIERGNPLCLLNDLGLVSTEEGGFLSFNFLKITW